MHKEIEDIIKRVYILKDYNFFISSCQRKVEFLDEILEILHNNCSNIELSNEPDSPCVEIYLAVNDFAENDFKVNYTSQLYINKIIDVFYFQHEFAVDNLDPNRIAPVLDGFSDESYCKLQYNLDETVLAYLQQKGYKRLYYSDMEEVVADVKMPKNTIFGSQMTVENAIFKDLWGICL